jgi:hypothetical protein
MYQVELMSPEHEALRLSILQDAVSVIRLIKNDVYHGEVYLMIWRILWIRRKRWRRAFKEMSSARLLGGHGLPYQPCLNQHSSSARIDRRPTRPGVILKDDLFGVSFNCTSCH